MKFTKQEQSLIKLAAAHMAPQMLKKATLQDKLAEYGIGMEKQAGDWVQPKPQFPKPPTPGLAQATPFMQTGAHLASVFAPAASGSIAKAVPTTAPAPAPAAPTVIRGTTPQMSALQRIMQYLAKGRQNGGAVR